MLLEAHCCFLTDVCSRKRNEESMLQILSSFKYFCFKHVNILNAFFKCTIIVQAVFSAEGRCNLSWHRRTTVTNPLCKLQVSHSYPWNLCQYFWRHMHKGFCINGKAAAVMKYFPWLQKKGANSFVSSKAEPYINCILYMPFIYCMWQVTACESTF